MTEALIRVQVAPGRRVRIDPHPSGLQDMAPLYVDAGEGLTVSEAAADQLYRRGDVLHPQTGQPRPAETFSTPPLVTKSSETFESMAARAELERNDPAKPKSQTVALDSWAQGHRQYEVRDPATTEQNLTINDEARHQW